MIYPVFKVAFGASAALLLAIAPACAQAVEPTPAVQPASYRINPGDQLEIYVWGEERLQRSVKVLPDGTMAFPLAGQLQVQGLLPQELEAVISDRLKTQYRGQVPQVTVSVVAPTGLQFSVMGKVKSPGSFSPGRYVTVLDALSMAGGPVEFANLDSILVIRKGAQGLTTLRVKVASLFKSGADASDMALARIPLLQTGDVIIVP